MSVDVKFSCIIDPNTSLAEQRLKEYGQGPNAHKWADCKLFKNHREMLQSQVALLSLVCPVNRHGILRQSLHAA